MTPGARLSAAIGILDRILAGAGAESALTQWGRSSRFAGSADRAAVRDIVFAALRRKRSAAALGGGMTGRGLVLGLCREDGSEALFSGEGHAPACPTAAEGGREPGAADGLDVPDWLLPQLEDSLGDRCQQVLSALRQRAPTFLRVNLARGGVDAALAALSADGITARRHALATTALEVTENARKIQSSRAYAEGLVELQDASSQAVVEALPLADGFRVLDYCAGGGGKSLAMAAQNRITLWAHDAAPRRMADLPDRARRAGIKVALTAPPEKTAPYDLVLVDAPCSGSGSWRRDPQGKWALTAGRLDQLVATQADILGQVAPMVRRGGWLAYATCSLLRAENGDQTRRFLSGRPDWTLTGERSLTPLDGGDGFYIALMQRN